MQNRCRVNPNDPNCKPFDKLLITFIAIFCILSLLANISIIITGLNAIFYWWKTDLSKPFTITFQTSYAIGSITILYHFIYEDYMLH